MRNVFVGRGWGFPLRVDSNGGIALVADEREIEEAMRIVLATSLAIFATSFTGELGAI